jgi:hypothetical protein
MMKTMLGFLSAAIAGVTVQTSATANATVHKKNVFVDDNLILTSFHSLPWGFCLQASKPEERETV